MLAHWEASQYLKFYCHFDNQDGTSQADAFKRKAAIKASINLQYLHPTFQIPDRHCKEGQSKKKKKKVFGLDICRNHL